MRMKKYVWVFIFFMSPIISKAQVFIQNENDSIMFEEYDNGRHWVYKKIDDVVVGLTINKGNDGYFNTYSAFFIIQNDSQTPFTFEPDEVYATITGKNGKSEELDVYTNEEYQKKIRRSQNWALGLQAFGAGLSGFSTATSHTNTPYGTYTTRTNYYNPAAVQSASLQTAMMEEKMRNDKEKIENNYLKKHTIYPNEVLEGYMNVDKKNGEVLSLTMQIKGNKFVFDWDVSSKNDKKKTKKSKPKKEKTSRKVYYSIMY